MPQAPNVREQRRYLRFNSDQPLVEFIHELQLALEQLPPNYIRDRLEPVVNRDEDGGAHYLEGFEHIFERPETDEEAQARLDNEEWQAEQERQRRIRQYRELRAEFAGVDIPEEEPVPAAEQVADAILGRHPRRGARVVVPPMPVLDIGVADRIVPNMVQAEWGVRRIEPGVVIDDAVAQNGGQVNWDAERRAWVANFVNRAPVDLDADAEARAMDEEEQRQAEMEADLEMMEANGELDEDL